MEIHQLDIEDLEEDDYELKFFVWSRKIEDEVNWLKEQGYSEEKIRNYLQKCADLRERFLDPADLTETEETHMEIMEEKGIWRKYGVQDPLNK